MNKVYVFDLDGTLINSVPYIKKSTAKYLNKFGIELTEKIYKDIIALGYVKTAEYFINKLNVNDTKENIVNTLYSYLIEEYAHNIFLKPYAKEFLQNLKNNGEKLFILSASPHIFVDPCLKNNGIYDYFSEIFVVDDFNLTKSTPDIFKIVADRIGIKCEDVTYFEDSISAIENSVQAGYKVFAVKDCQDEETLNAIKQIVNGVVYSFKDICAYKYYKNRRMRFLTHRRFLYCTY